MVFNFDNEKNELEEIILHRIECAFGDNKVDDELTVNFSGIKLTDPNVALIYLIPKSYGGFRLEYPYNRITIDFSNNLIVAWNWDDYTLDLEYTNKIQRLIFANNQIKSFPNNTGEYFKNITSLDLSSNQLEILPSTILQLSNLQHFDISKNRFTKLSHRIGEFKELVDLNVSDNMLNSLPSELGNLVKLERLNIESTKISSLPQEIQRLQKLTTLTAANSELSIFPDGVSFLKNLKILDLRNTLLPFPPEILEKVDTPVEIINYYRNTYAKKRPLSEAKILAVGQGSVGKTSIISRILNNIYNPNEYKTEGICIQRFGFFVGEKPLFGNIWDFGGQEIMHATHQFFLTKRSLYLLVLDARLTQEENRVEYWLKIIQSFGGESPVLIVGNKTDQHSLDIDRTGLQKKYPNIVGVLETSAATGAGIEVLRSEIVKQVNTLPHVRDLLPETWFTVKVKLEELGRDKNFITQDEYLGLCDTNDVKDETSQRTLIGFLHDLGVVLHFQDDPRLEALGILNPQWVTNGVYKILNSHTLFQNKGVLTTSTLDEILNLPEYPRGKRLFIVDMMKKFELCYDIPYGYDVEPDKTFLVPDLLPKDEPAELKFNGVPAFEYAYPVLPSSVITRFIVRMNQHIHDNCVWRTGVVLKIGGNHALVKADIEDRKITIAIDGLEHTRRDTLSAIRYQLDEIHGSIKGLNPEKRVPIPEAPNAEPLEYDYLLMLEREGQETHLVKDGNRLIKVNVRQVLSGIESEADRKESGNRITNIYIGGNVKDSNIVAGDENTVENR